MKIIPSISCVPHPPEDFLEVTSKDVPKEQGRFVAGIDKKESNEEKLMRSVANKDKDPAFKEPRVILDSKSAMGTSFPIPPTEVAESSRVNEVSTPAKSFSTRFPHHRVFP
ncbi:hypothetical protein ACOSQ3_019672 [Xanthoceras sorbifolium]